MTTPKTCPRCGATYEPSRSPHGLCLKCLVGVGMRDPGEVIETQGAPRETAPALDAIAPLFPELVLEELIGQGGMGFVYRARHPELDRKVALKLLARTNASDPAFVERFRREARTLARLAHPGIVTIFDSGERGGWCYLVMEYVEGASLRHLMRSATIEPKQALSIVSQVCDALQYSHDQGVVHRDIKPENVLLDLSGRVKLADFGLARVLDKERGAFALTGSHQVMGTPHYMAPEQWEKPSTVDHRADIYAVGVVFYELLTGEMPLGRFEAPSKRVQVDVRLDEIVLKSLEKQPERRYQHASEVRSDVDSVASGAPEPPTRRAPAVSTAVRDFGAASISNGKSFLLGLVFFVGLYSVQGVLAHLLGLLYEVVTGEGPILGTITGRSAFIFVVFQLAYGLPGMIAGWHFLRLSSRASPVWSTRGWTGFDGAACVYAAMLVYLFAVSVSQGTPTVILNHSTLYFGIGALSLGALSWRRWSWRPRAEARPA
ncbi:MAG: serine/threonine-protein kinase [Planctomycetota bacterium]